MLNVKPNVKDASYTGTWQITRYCLKLTPKKMVHCDVHQDQYEHCQNSQNNALHGHNSYFIRTSSVHKILTVTSRDIFHKKSRNLTPKRKIFSLKVHRCSLSQMAIRVGYRVSKALWGGCL